jgi:hypothetical protein
MTISRQFESDRAASSEARPEVRSEGRLPESPIEIRWSAIRPVATDERTDARAPFTACSAFVLLVQALDEQHVLLETWLESPAGSRTVLERQPAKCSIVPDGNLLHLDVERNGRRVLALTLEEQALGRRNGRDGGGRPRYAATTLLAQAGFTAGSYDPPTARVVAAARDAASA